MEHIPTEKTKIIKVSDIKDVLNSEMGVLLEQDYVCNQMNFQSYKNTITTKLQDNRLKLQRFYQNLSEKLKIPNNLYVKFLMKR